MSQAKTSDYLFTLTGGELCLDFANTLDDRPTDQPIELLNTYSDFLLWGQQAALIDLQGAQELMNKAQQAPEATAVVLEKAITLRELIYRIFSAIAAGVPPVERDLDRLNNAVSCAFDRLKIVRTTAGFEWGWDVASGELDQLVWPITRSAADLLTSNELTKLRECAGFDCGWLFMDRSRAHRRRWCDMKICGNREKARRHYQRKKST